jgi:acylpyruvate hydrolase
MDKYWRVCSKAVCAGRNYVAHAAELNNPLPSAPFFFLKPTSSFLPFNDTPLGGISKTPNAIEYPKENELHHELELMVVIGKEARNVDEADALSFVSGYSIGLEMTLRDVQTIYKEKKLPWTAAKAFDTSMALGPFISKEMIPNPNEVDLWLTVNEDMRQSDSTSLMIFSVERLIAEASKIMTLYPGDVIATGTPKGVGQVKSGDVLKAGIRGFESFDVEFTCSGL